MRARPPTAPGNSNYVHSLPECAIKSSYNGRRILCDASCVKDVLTHYASHITPHDPAMTEFSWRTRREAHTHMTREECDVLIIGGGITGAGLALDAVSRGLRVALVEKRDFAAGTSSRSTKLIHGGLRYLEHFNFALVREGLRERAILARIA